jgi:hypothetical protein
MKPAQLQRAALRQLYDRFIAAALEQHESMLYGDNDKYNRLYEEIIAIEKELKRRGQDEIRALASLFDHPSAQLRLNAAVATLALEPEAARQALQLTEMSTHRRLMLVTCCGRSTGERTGQAELRTRNVWFARHVGPASAGSGARLVCWSRSSLYPCPARGPDRTSGSCAGPFCVCRSRRHGLGASYKRLRSINPISRYALVVA